MSTEHLGPVALGPVVLEASKCTNWNQYWMADQPLGNPFC